MPRQPDWKAVQKYRELKEKGLSHRQIATLMKKDRTQIIRYSKYVQREGV